MMREVKDWAVAGLIAVMSAASMWGMLRNTVNAQGEDIKALKGWKDDTSTRLVRIEDKIDQLLDGRRK